MRAKVKRSDGRAKKRAASWKGCDRQARTLAREAGGTARGTELCAPDGKACPGGTKSVRPFLSPTTSARRWLHERAVDGDRFSRGERLAIGGVQGAGINDLLDLLIETIDLFFRQRRHREDVWRADPGSHRLAIDQ